MFKQKLIYVPLILNIALEKPHLFLKMAGQEQVRLIHSYEELPSESFAFEALRLLIAKG